MSGCEVSKDKTWVGQYTCSTHGVWFRASGDDVDCCPCGHIEDDLNADINNLCKTIQDLKAEVERLKGVNTAARQLVATMWSSADDWHGPKVSSHYRSELIEKMAVLIDRGDSWPTEGEKT